MRGVHEDHAMMRVSDSIHMTKGALFHLAGILGICQKEATRLAAEGNLIKVMTEEMKREDNYAVVVAWLRKSIQ